MRENGNQGVLAQISRFAGHVRARQQGQAGVCICGSVQCAIIGNKRATAIGQQGSLHHRMTTAAYIKHQIIAHFRLHPIACHGEARQSGGYIQRGQGFRAGFNLIGQRDSFFAQLFENFGFQRQSGFPCTAYFSRQRRKLFGGKAHRICQCLAVDENFIERRCH